VQQEKADHHIATLCRVLGVSPSGHYAWCDQPPSARAKADQVLLVRIRAIHERSRGTYGAPRIHAELRARGVRCGRKRVARLMRQEGLSGLSDGGTEARRGRIPPPWGPGPRTARFCGLCAG